MRQVLLLRSRLRLQPVDLIDATAKTSDDRVEQERVDPRPAASVFAVAASRGPEEVGDGREDEAQEESEKEREEA